MVIDFHQTLWESWNSDNSQLNWTDFDFAQIESPIIEDKWLEDQEWILKDPNQFYYPLFGLGNLDSSVAFVATGPGHNVTEPWNGCVDTARYRESLAGPCKNKSRWETSDDSPYESNFKEQKNEWEAQRGQSKSLYENVDHVTDGELWDGEIYYTNFMKDGEFIKNGDSKIGVTELKNRLDSNTVDKLLSDDLNHNLKSDRWTNVGMPDDIESGAGEFAEIISREFWLPVLGAELSAVNPDVIVPLGEKAWEAVYDLYEPKSDLNDISEAALHRYTTAHFDGEIIPSVHLSRANNYWISKKNEIYNRRVKSDSGESNGTNVEKHLQILSDQIKSSLSVSEGV
ncbi:uracil-DNA glycosylase family protein [Halomicroarcula sp. GCM10025709]|uniref:uracil-DNA glycosylase family protein n=1 Tax=Haloarcula TaxID=2237 RepID=UPI0024C31E5F|nr:uracil-DNA glycosylase family protein [Halomicroarcula sp. YJ-61-S]